jgi:hypothetical protein
MKELEKDDVIFFLKVNNDLYLVNSSNQELEGLVYSTWGNSIENESMKYFYKVDKLPAQSISRISEKDAFLGNSYNLESCNEEDMENLVSKKINDLSNLADYNPNVYFLRQELGNV